MAVLWPGPDETTSLANMILTYTLGSVQAHAKIKSVVPGVRDLPSATLAVRHET